MVAAASAAALLAAGGAAAAPAAATVPWSDCPSGSLCLYDGTNFTGELFTVSSLGPHGTCVSLVDHGWEDRASSVVNLHDNVASMFMHDDCVGGPWPLGSNSSHANLGSFTPDSVWVPGS